MNTRILVRDAMLGDGTGDAKWAQYVSDSEEIYSSILKIYRFFYSSCLLHMVW